jgi:hypothetical protein
VNFFGFGEAFSGTFAGKTEEFRGKSIFGGFHDFPRIFALLSGEIRGIPRNSEEKNKKVSPLKKTN